MHATAVFIHTAEFSAQAWHVAVLITLQPIEYNGQLRQNQKASDAVESKCLPLGCQSGVCSESPSVAHPLLIHPGLLGADEAGNIVAAR